MKSYVTHLLSHKTLDINLCYASQASAENVTAIGGNEILTVLYVLFKL